MNISWYLLDGIYLLIDKKKFSFNYKNQTRIHKNEFFFEETLIT
jgi:hypothetical protein